MEVKDLQREAMLTMIITERNAMILDLNEQITALKAEIESLRRQLGEYKTNTPI
jgi:phage host-nuclease inhibitor protein Gam